jgi:hypothetical protein
MKAGVIDENAGEKDACDAIPSDVNGTNKLHWVTDMARNSSRDEAFHVRTAIVLIPEGRGQLLDRKNAHSTDTTPPSQPITHTVFHPCQCTSCRIVLHITEHTQRTVPQGCVAGQDTHQDRAGSGPKASHPVIDPHGCTVQALKGSDSLLENVQSHVK